MAHLFDMRTWHRVPILVGTISLVPGKRTVSTAWYVWELQDESRLAIYHQVLSRARRSSLAVSWVLLGLLLRHLAPTTEPLLFGIACSPISWDPGRFGPCLKFAL